MKVYETKILVFIVVLVLLISVFSACEKQESEKNQSVITSAQTQSASLLSENDNKNASTSSVDMESSKNSSKTPSKNEIKSSSSESKPSSSIIKSSSSHKNTTTQNTSSNVDLTEYKVNFTYSSLQKYCAEYIEKNGTGVPKDHSCVVHEREKIGDSFALLNIPNFRILSLNFLSAWNKDKIEIPHQYFFSIDGRFKTTDQAYCEIFKAVSAFEKFSEGKAAKYKLKLNSFNEPFIYDKFEDIPTKYLRRLSSGSGENYFTYTVEHPESTVPAVESGIAIHKEANGYYVAVYYDVFFDFSYGFND